MNTKHIITIGCLLLASFFVGCNSTTNETDTATKNETDTTENWEAQMYEPSELVKIMRTMYADNLQLKEALKKGEQPHEMPDLYRNILSAKATNPTDLKQSYFAMANVYLDNYQAMVKATPNNRINAYNNMVNTCIACHQNYCLGPIPKIKKLIINQP